MLVPTTLQRTPVVELAPISRPTVSLTERGHRLLALLNCREILPTSSTTVAAVLDRRIADLLVD